MRSSKGTMRSVFSCVASSTTGQAAPACCTSSQRAAQTHQRSPGLRPLKPYCGMGVERSLPSALLAARKAASTTQQMVWTPRSSGPVLQQPSRKKPVMGLQPQVLRGRPRTFLPGACCVSRLAMGSSDAFEDSLEPVERPEQVLLFDDEGRGQADDVVVGLLGQNAFAHERLADG